MTEARAAVTAVCTRQALPGLTGAGLTWASAPLAPSALLSHHSCHPHSLQDRHCFNQCPRREVKTLVSGYIFISYVTKLESHAGLPVRRGLLPPITSLTGSPPCGGTVSPCEGAEGGPLSCLCSS